MQRAVTTSVPAVHARPRWALAVGVLAGALTVLTACTGRSSSSSDFDAWYEQMQTVFSHTNGSGGGGGAAPGSVELGSMKTGRFVVYAVCDDTRLIHLRIRGGSRILAETDVPCGATIAVPITVDAAAARRFEIETSHPRGITGTGWWSVQVNSTSWKQAATFGFD